MSGMYTWRDCRRAARLIAPGAWVTGVLLWFGTPAALSATGAYFLSMDPGFVIIAVLLTTLFGIIAISLCAARSVLAHQMWRNVRDNPVRRWVTQSAIRTDTPTATATETWSQYDRYAKGPEILVLRERSKAAFAVLPRSHCSSDDDWQAVLRIVEGNLQVGRWGLMAR
jgi:hypothetical protein